MCGINGIISSDASAKVREGIAAMNSALAHRGPDDEGEAFFDCNGKTLGFGHRRLSIIDLSADGHQPMSNKGGRFTVIFNGELYNYKSLKFDLSRAVSGSGTAPYDFKTNSDTEVVLAAWTAWGMDCLRRFEGMFAFALWDDLEKKLCLVRDRLGKKPLYYSEQSGNLVFSSELRALMASGMVKRKLNTDSLADYFRYQTVHAPSTILKDVQMLMPGTILEKSAAGITLSAWWDPLEAASGKKDSDILRDPVKINKRLLHLLIAAVEKRLVSDVPFGAFLSGGIDSSIIVALMSKVSSSRVKTFSVIFDEKAFSEEKYSSAVAAKYNTEHHPILLKPDDLLASLPDVLSAMDHPGGDGPNTYMVSKATKHAGITMALSGVGGDELFGGYDLFRRIMAHRKKNWLTVFPSFSRKLAGSAIGAFKGGVAGQKAEELLAADSFRFSDAYHIHRLVFPEKVMRKLLKKEFYRKNRVQEMSAKYASLEAEQLVSAVSLAEMNSYMQNVLLRDTDNMAMAHALEVRAPFLDHDLVEFVLSLTDDVKPINPPKALLLEAVGDLLPAEVINRKKMGFTFPWKHWMKHELKEMCETRLRTLSQRAFIGEKSPLMLWDAFLKDDRRVPWSRVWHLVALEDWLQRNHVNE